MIEVEADWQANYTGRLINLLVPDGTPPDFVPALFQQYPQIDGTFSSLDLSIETGQIVNSTGTYDFTLGTPNPTQLGAGNTVALGGEYHLSDVRFGTSYGTVTGQASIVRFLGAGAPYQVVSSITAVTETTHLDASGLVTPQVAVTDGIDMGGSNLTNLAAGVAPTDAVNVAQLDQESTARQAADAALQGNIDAEATNRAQADVQLVQRIAAEEASRQSADVVLQEGIAAEAMTRAQADLQLNQRVGAAESGQANLAVALSNEVNARMAADLAAANMIAGFGNQLNTLSAQVDALASRVDAFEDNVASSTSGAVALGGNAFLPDTRFNLTANVGTYGGAHAGSFQLGALVSRNVAINAGVATGFNRGGKTGGRVGMTLGW